jgi:hypothetical protein
MRDARRSFLIARRWCRPILANPAGHARLQRRLWDRPTLDKAGLVARFQGNFSFRMEIGRAKSHSMAGAWGSARLKNHSRGGNVQAKFPSSAAFSLLRRESEDVWPLQLKKCHRALFRFHASGRLRGMLAHALNQAGLSFPRRQGCRNEQLRYPARRLTTFSGMI